MNYSKGAYTILAFSSFDMSSFTLPCGIDSEGDSTDKQSVLSSTLDFQARILSLKKSMTMIG